MISPPLGKTFIPSFPTGNDLYETEIIIRTGRAYTLLYTLLISEGRGRAVVNVSFDAMIAHGKYLSVLPTQAILLLKLLLLGAKCTTEQGRSPRNQIGEIENNVDKLVVVSGHEVEAIKNRA